MKEVFYKKVGRRYVPVSEYDSELCSALPKGTHLIMCYPGGTSTRYRIDPMYAPMIAASRSAEDAISRAIMEKSEMRPHQSKPLTPAQLKAWQELAKEMGDQRYPLEYASYREAAEAGVAAMQQAANELMTNPNIRRAYDEFMLVCKLTNTESKYD